MSYTPFVFFGYEIQLPPEMSLRRSIPMLYDLNVMIQSPFQIKCLLPTYYLDMNEEEHARMVIGFCPEQLNDTIQLARELEVFVEDSLLLEGLEIAHMPLFHCGVEWCPDEDDYSETSESSETDQSSEYESDDDSEVETEDESESESDT
jgi:hypothetical protein